MPRKKARVQKPTEVDRNDQLSTYTLENQENNGSELVTALSIFRECEDSHAHDRLIIQLKIDFYDKLNIDEFSEDFFNCCRFILSIEDRLRSEIPWKFVVKFVVYCISKCDNENENELKEKSLTLLRRLIKFLVWHFDVQKPFVRFNAVKSVRILLNELTDDVEIPDKLFGQIQGALLKRFWDVKSFIRSEAAHAASRLQSPSDANCPIVVSLIHLCKFDSSHTVRLAAMQALAITTKTLPVIIARCRDVNDLVRKKSFDLMIKWKILKPLTVSKRLQLMETGLTDKSDLVKGSAVELLRVWLALSDKDPVVLLRRFDVENGEQATEMTLKTMLGAMTIAEIDGFVDYIATRMDERHLIVESELNSEIVFFWRHLVHFLNEKQTDNADKIEKLIPNVADYEQYLRKLFDKLIEQTQSSEVNLEECIESQTIIKHLLCLTKFMDIYDQHNRQLMIDLIKWALSSPNIPFSYVEHLMKLLVLLESNNEKICNLTVEIINELLFSDNEITVTDQSGTDKSPRSVAVTPSSSHHSETCNTAAVEVITEQAAPVMQDNREAIRQLKIKIADFDIKINEMKESLSQFMSANKYDDINQLVNDLKFLEEQRKQLEMQKLQMISANNPITNNQPQEQEQCQEEMELNVNEEGNNEVKREVKETHLWMQKGMEHIIIKANVMTITMVQECNLLWILPSSLRTVFENVILVSVQHPEVAVRQQAILSMGLCCLLDKDLALQYYKLFLQSIKIDADSIKEISVKSLVDIYIRFGIEPFQESLMIEKEASAKIERTESAVKLETSDQSHETGVTEEDYNRCTTELMSPIIELLNSKCIDLQSTVAIGLSKLLYHHKLMSAKLLSRLLLLWFNPETEDNLKLRQYLAAFFTNFSLMSADNQDAIASCFLITMKTLFKAPAKSRLLEIDFNNVIDFFERVTDSKYLIDSRQANVDRSKLENPCQDSLALTLANQILISPLSSEIRYYVPMLTRLRLSPGNIDIVRTLQPMVATMIKEIKDKKYVLVLEKFNKQLLKRLEDTVLETMETGDQQQNADNEDVDTTIVKEDKEIVFETPTSVSRAPSLLEMGSDGRKLNATYIGGRKQNHTQRNLIMDDTLSQISSINLDDSCTIIPTGPAAVKTTTTTASTSAVPVTPARELTDMPPPNMTGNESVFRRQRNVRVTRSSSRSLMSQDSQVSSSSHSSSPITRSKKK